MDNSAHGSRRSLRSLEWLNFFLADVQTGLGPFLAAYLAASGWNPAQVGYALTFGGIVTVALQAPAGAIVDAAHRKRLLVAVNLGLLAAGALLLMGKIGVAPVYAAQALLGMAGPFLGPAIAAITLGIVGAGRFDRQFGRNQSFNAAGNVATALLVAYIGYRFGFRAVYWVAIAMIAPTLVCLLTIDGREIDYARARGGIPDGPKPKSDHISHLFRDGVLLAFLGAAFLFHLANAAMLPQLGEMLAQGKPKEAAPFMSACILVTQFLIALSAAWIGRQAATRGRKPLLLAGFGVLPVRAVLYTLVHGVAALVAVQVLDGVANAIFGIVSILVIKDRTQGSGRFNLASGVLATTVGIGAALSNSLGGAIVQRFGYNASFLGLGAVAIVAFAVLCFSVPETLRPSADPARLVLAPEEES